MMPMDDILREVPQHLLTRVRQHLSCLEDFNAGVARMRTLEQRVGSPGRYEWEFRLQREPDTQQRVAWLEQFATLAREHGIDPEVVFAALGGRPTLEPWSPAAQAWQREAPHAEEQRDA